MPIIRTPALDLAYLDDGPVDGPTVIMVHGFPDNPSTWDRVHPDLPAGVRLIRPYLRGCGDSRLLQPDGPGGGAQVAALAQDILDLADVLELTRFTLVGHDWGARAAHATAVLAPERLTGLVTLSTAYGPMTHLSPADRFAEASSAWYRYWLCTDRGAREFALTASEFVEYAWREWSPGLRLSTSDTAALHASFDNDLFADLVVDYYRHGAGAAPGRDRYATAQARLDEWPAIAVPTTFLLGLDDGCEVAAASRGNGAYFTGGYERIELPGVGHFIQRERPDIVARAVAGHL